MIASDGILAAGRLLVLHYRQDGRFAGTCRRHDRSRSIAYVLPLELRFTVRVHAARKPGSAQILHLALR